MRLKGQPSVNVLVLLSEQTQDSHGANVLC